jgi:predicted HicB family RNase H-like nuclease
VAKLKQNDSVIKQVIAKNSRERKRQISQLTIKIDSQLDQALIKLSTALGISKNRLIEDILRQSGIIEEVEENYHE